MPRNQLLHTSSAQQYILAADPEDEHHISVTIEKKQFGYHSKDNGDEWWFYLARDSDRPHKIFVIHETEFGGRRSEKHYGLAEYLASGNRGTTKLTELIGTLISD